MEVACVDCADDHCYSGTRCRLVAAAAARDALAAAAFGRDNLLDDLSLHWFTGAGAAAIRLYRESALDPGASGKVRVPTAILMPLRDGVTVPAPREWAERTFNVRRWTLMERGGHFPEWEVPRFVADDLRAFFAEIAA